MRQRDLKPDVYWGRVHKLPKEYEVFSISKGSKLLLRVYRDGLSVVVRSGALKGLFKKVAYPIDDRFGGRSKEKGDEMIHEMLAAALLYDAYGMKLAKALGQEFGRYGQRNGGAARWRFNPSQLFVRLIEVQRWSDDLMALMDVSNTPPAPPPVQVVYYHYA